MHTVKTAAITLVLFAAPMFVSAADTAPASSSKPAATVAANDPKGTVKAFMEAMFDGNENGVYSSLSLANEEADKEAHAVFGELLAQQQLQDLLDSTFKPADGAPSSADMKKSTKGSMGQQLDTTEVTINGDNAAVKIGPKMSIHLLKEKGAWKIDFEKTQRANEGPYDKDRVNGALAKAQIYRDMAGELKQQKYKTRQDAEKEIEIRIAKAPDPARGADLETAKGLSTITQLSNLKTALETFEMDNGRYPTNEEGLDALVHSPKNSAVNWHKLLDEVPVDAWGHAFIYTLNGDKSDFDISSAGPDGKPGTADDITRTTKP